MKDIKILIVEDEFIVAKDLQAYLEKLGYTVCGRVNSGEKAIHHVQCTLTNLVLMDIMLKGEMTGIEAAGQIREQFRLPVIYVTANTNPGIVAQAKLTEPFGFIVKPFNERELHANIEMSLYKHRMERELAEQKALLDDIFSGVQEGIALLDDYLNVVFCNPAYARLVDVPQHELSGQNAFLFFDNESRSLLVQEMKTRHKGCHSSYELPLTTMKGIEKYVRVTVAPRVSAEGTVIGEFVTMLDITARKQAEEEVRRHRDHLEKLVEQRASELIQINNELVFEVSERQKTQEAAQEAQYAAESANRSKTEFIANMSHELRTPLEGILSNAQMLEQPANLSERQIEGLTIIRESGKHLLRVLSDILDMAKLETGNVAIAHQPFALSAALQELLRQIRLQARNKGLECLYQFDDSLPDMVYGDEQRLRQILMNLLDNAIKFTRHGSVSLRVTTVHDPYESSDTATQQLLFEVSDTGIGIPQEHLSHIFEPFEQLSDTHIFVDGPGLGLSISQRLLRMMGSELFVESQEDTGSRFWFELALTGMNETDREQIET